jgi:hypothetical protein
LDIVTTSKIISKQVLNDATGELELTSFNEMKKTKRLRGGFNMIYHKSFENILEEVVRSNTDIKLFNWVTNRFTYNIIERTIVYPDCPINISKSQFTYTVKKLVDVDYLKRISRGVYRLNPFTYLPYKADGEVLQKEWNELSKQQVYKIVDETPKELVAVTRDDIAKLGANGFTLLIQAGFKAGMSVERQWEVYNLVSK